MDKKGEEEKQKIRVVTDRIYLDCGMIRYSKAYTVAFRKSILIELPFCQSESVSLCWCSSKISVLPNGSGSLVFTCKPVKRSSKVVSCCLDGRSN